VTGDSKPRKFERPTGVSNRLDCHPRMTPILTDPSVPLWVPEGVVKGDALVSVGLAAVSLLGVSNWVTRTDDSDDSVPVADWDDVALDGRLVVIAFDADCMAKQEVEAERQKLTVFLHRRGATVRWLYLPDPKNKTGVDDFLSAGHSVADLWSRVRQPRFAIRARGRSLPVTTTEALAALALRNEPPTIFRRGRAVVEVDGATRSIIELDQARLKNRLARAGEWFVTDKDGNRKPASPPDEVVKDAAVSYEDHRYPQLSRVVDAPVFAGRPDWTLRTEPGYDAATGNLYIPPKGLVVPPVPERPTEQQALAALADLRDYLADFPFKEDADEAHALALLLQPFARGLMRDAVTPLYVAEAPTEGTGKGLLLETLLVPGVGSVEGLGPKTDEREIEKNITTFFLESRPVIFFDNWPTDKKFASASVASALTMKQYTSRILGVSKFVSAPNNVVWLLSANNPKFSPEIRRRIIRIRLDAGLEDPKARSGFNKTLPGDALANRGRMIHDACTVIAYWLSIGRPGPDEAVPPIGSFSAWRYVMGGILGAVGVDGFLGNLRAASADDDNPERAVAADVFRVIHENHGIGKSFTAVELEPHLNRADLMNQVVPQHTRDEYRTTALGNWLRDHKDRVYDGQQLRQGKRKNQGYAWYLEERSAEATR